MLNNIYDMPTFYSLSNIIFLIFKKLADIVKQNKKINVYWYRYVKPVPKASPVTREKKR